MRRKCAKIVFKPLKSLSYMEKILFRDKETYFPTYQQLCTSEMNEWSRVGKIKGLSSKFLLFHKFVFPLSVLIKLLTEILFMSKTNNQ